MGWGGREGGPAADLTSPHRDGSPSGQEMTKKKKVARRRAKTSIKYQGRAAPVSLVCMFFFVLTTHTRTTAADLSGD